MRASLLFTLGLLVSLPTLGSTVAQDAELHSDIDVGVVLDGAEQSGRASAKVRIRASREVVWSLITDCAEALNIVPGLSGCQVVQTAPDHSWQLIQHVLNYSWFVRRLSYEIRATYNRPVSVTVARVSGDLKSLTCSWNLQPDGDYTVASYVVDLAPGFWVPQWLVRGALRRDLPTMLRALRTRAEFVASR